MKLVIEYQYLPPVYLFSALYKHKHIVFEECELYQKMSFRNRCMLAGAEGVIQLSIPLIKGRNQKTPITEVQIDNRYHWQQQHWRTIESSYRKSPWFDHYAPGLENFYSTDYTHLLKWNLDLFRWIIEKSELDITTESTTDFNSAHSDTNIVDLRNTLLPKTYIKQSVNPYQQVFSDRTGFLPNLSILDLLFCMGRNTKEYLKRLSDHLP